MTPLKSRYQCVAVRKPLLRLNSVSTVRLLNRCLKQAIVCRCGRYYNFYNKYFPKSEQSGSRLKEVLLLVKARRQVYFWRHCETGQWNPGIHCRTHDHISAAERDPSSPDYPCWQQLEQRINTPKRIYDIGVQTLTIAAMLFGFSAIIVFCPAFLPTDGDARPSPHT